MVKNIINSISAASYRLQSLCLCLFLIICTYFPLCKRPLPYLSYSWSRGKSKIELHQCFLAPPWAHPAKIMPTSVTQGLACRVEDWHPNEHVSSFCRFKPAPTTLLRCLGSSRGISRSILLPTFGFQRWEVLPASNRPHRNTDLSQCTLNTTFLTHILHLCLWRHLQVYDKARGESDWVKLTCCSMWWPHRISLSCC